MPPSRKWPWRLKCARIITDSRQASRRRADLSGYLPPAFDYYRPAHSQQQGHYRRECAFAHESGIHQDGMLKHRETYEIMTPQSVGPQRKPTLVIGKHSGRNAVRSKFEALGYSLDDEQLNQVLMRSSSWPTARKQIHDEDPHGPGSAGNLPYSGQPQAAPCFGVEFRCRRRAAADCCRTFMDVDGIEKRRALAWGRLMPCSMSYPR